MIKNKIATDVFALVALSVVLGLVLFCVQVHSIEFWKLVVGEDHAVIWSITVEIMVISSWIMSNIKSNGHEFKIKLLAIVATLVTMCAPILNTVVPVIDNVSTKMGLIDSYDERVELQKLKVAMLEEGVTDYRDNSNHKTGWLGKIDETEEKYETEMAKLETLVSKRPSVVDLFEESVMTIMISVSIFIFQLGGIVISNVIGVKLNRLFNEESREEDQDQEKKEFGKLGVASADGGISWSESKDEKDLVDEGISRVAADAMAVPKVVVSNNELFGNDIEGDDEYLSRLCKFVNKYIVDQKRKQTDVAASLGVSARDLSLLVKHNEKMETGEDFRRISKNKALIIADKLSFTK